MARIPEPFDSAASTPTRTAVSPSVQRTRALTQDAAKFDALRNLKAQMGADANLLDVLPFNQASIRYHNDQKLLANRKAVLAAKIRIGTIEDENGTNSALWGYLFDNSFTHGATDLVYYSFGRQGKPGTRQTQGDAHESKLREEFRHCATPAVLNATAKYYLYKKGVVASFPIQVSRHLAEAVLRSCKDYGDAMQDNADISSNYQNLSTYSSPQVDNNSIRMLQAVQTKQRQVVLEIHSVQQRRDASKQNVGQLHTMREKLQTQLTQLEMAINAGEADMAEAERELGRHGETMRQCRIEEENIMGGMDHNVRAMIELGRQMERGSQQGD